MPLILATGPSWADVAPLLPAVAFVLVLIGILVVAIRSGGEGGSSGGGGGCGGGDGAARLMHALSTLSGFRVIT